MKNLKLKPINQLLFLLTLLVLFGCKDNNNSIQNQTESSSEVSTIVDNSENELPICLERKNYEGDNLYEGLEISNVEVCLGNYSDEYGNVKKTWMLKGFISNVEQQKSFQGIKFKISYWDDTDELIGMEEVMWNEIVNENLISKQFYIELQNSPPSYSKKFRILIFSAGTY